MSFVMLVTGSDSAEPVVGPEAAERLAEIGITRISLLSDASGIGVVLEGWAFDPAHVDEAVRALYPAGAAGVRILREVEHVAVVPMLEKGRS